MIEIGFTNNSNNNNENTIKLNDGNKIPMIGLGTYDSNGQHNSVAEAVTIALENGYKHIDCAACYGNEKEIGLAMKNVFKKGKIQRKDIFITSKLWNSCHRKSLVRKHCEKSLKDLQLDYLDLYLVHWPVSFKNKDPNGLTIENEVDENGNVVLDFVPMRETWEEMEKLVKEGLVKSIGVANFNVQSLIELFSFAKIKPTVNQIECHPYYSNPNLKQWCDRWNIVITCYSPIGQRKNNLLKDPILSKIASNHNKPVSNIIFRWCIQLGFNVIPKSITSSRIIENINIFDFELSEIEMNEINSLNTNTRTCCPIEIWNLPIFG